MTRAKLTPDNFYRTWIPLLTFVAERQGIATPVSDGLPEGKMDAEEAVQLREALWGDATLVRAFVEENPARLDAADLALAASWQYGTDGTFTIARHLKDHSVFLKGDGARMAFAVHALVTPLAEMFPRTPTLVRAHLLPFGDRIVTDGLVHSYAVALGPGIRRAVKDELRDIEERDGVATTLGPDGPGWEVPDAERARRSNAKVMAAFRRHLRSASMTDRRCDEHVEQLRAWAEVASEGHASPRRLVDADDEDLEAFLARSPRADPTSFVRFARFLRDTQRMEPEATWLLQDVANQARRAQPRPSTLEADA